MSPISIITCVVGIIGCIIGVATFVSAQITKAKQDGMVLAKIDQCVKGIEDIKDDMKEKNQKFDDVIDEHTEKIVRLETQVKELYNRLDSHIKEGKE